MASTLECLGLGVEDDAGLLRMVEQVLPDAVDRGSAGPVRVWRWTDPSGARLTAGLEDGSLRDFVPSYAGEPGALLGGVASVGDDGVVVADVVVEGRTATRMACDLEQFRRLDGDDTRSGGPAAITALGVEVVVLADAAAFAAADVSLLGDATAAAEGRTARFATESFLSHGLFSETDSIAPVAFLSGTVLDSETRTVELTGQSFHAVEVRTAGFTATLCLAASEHPAAPVAGNVVAGTCYLVACIEALEPAPEPAPEVEPKPAVGAAPARRRWFGRRG